LGLHALRAEYADRLEEELSIRRIGGIYIVTLG